MKKLYIALATTALSTGLLTAPVAAKADHKHNKHHKFHDAAPAAMPVTEENNFAGWHAGVSLGLENGHGKANVSATANPATVADRREYTASGDQSQLGVIGGLNFGYDHFFNPTYFAGLEIGGDLSSLEGRTKLNHSSTGTINLSTQLKADKDWQVSAALRAGMLIDSNLLAYGHLGWVGAKWKIKAIMTDQGRVTEFKDDKFKNGLRVGLGMAKMVNRNIQCGMDVAYTWFEDVNKTKGGIDSVAAGAFGAASQKVQLKAKFSPETFEGRLFMKWKFNGIA